MAAVRNIVLCYCVVVLVAFAQGSVPIIGGDCSIGNCASIGGECNINNICVCHAEDVPNSNKTACVPIQSNIGDPCEVDAQCNITNSMCGKNNTCTKIVDTVGESCNENTTCFLSAGADNYVSCTNGKCTCNSGYEPTKDKKKCDKTNPNTGSLPLLSVNTAVFVLVAKMLS